MLVTRFASFLLLFVFAPGVAQAPPAFAASADEVWVPAEDREKAPRLSLRDLQGKKRQLSELKGQIVVVNFWATWCAPCKVEMPEFTKVHAEYRDRGVEFVGAAHESRSSKNKVEEFVRRLEIQFPIWLEASLDHLEAFRVDPALPATVIVDAQGRVAARIKGVTDAAELRELLDRVLSEAAPTRTSAGGR
jgi:peroxiredoxin